MCNDHLVNASAMERCEACGVVAARRHQSSNVLVPALRTVGNIVTGDDLQTQVIINCGALSCLLHLLKTSQKKSIKKEACWTISNITAGTKEQIQARPCCPCTPLLTRSSLQAACPATQQLGYRTSHNTKPPTATQAGSLITFMCIILEAPDPSQGCLGACTQSQSADAVCVMAVMQAVIDADLILPLVHMLGEAEFDIKKEAAWAISNATSGGRHDQIKYLVASGAIKPLCDLLTCSDPRIVTVALEGIENILKVPTSHLFVLTPSYGAASMEPDDYTKPLFAVSVSAEIAAMGAGEAES